ncbi:MAG: class I SAM-dependent methyltransferase [Burkholderiaceae bacterium]|nr:class I SAM-dependent methyltransferase [Burkholderiaceae bacterium]
MTDHPTLSWTDADGASHTVRWRSESGARPPKRVQLVDDQLNADTAYRLACEGTGLLWCGDFHNAKLLLQALTRRVERKPHKPKAAAQAATPTLARASAAPASGPFVRKAKAVEADSAATGADPAAAEAAAAAFHLHRKAQAERARILGMLLLPFDADHSIPLRRAPDVREACSEAWGPGSADASQASVASLRELLGLIGAHEWRRKGLPLDALGGARIHPHYGVFSPVRGEYLDLVAQAPLPAALQQGGLAFDLGTGTGVLAALLARRGVKRIVATDCDPRALACAQDNLQRLKCSKAVELLATGPEQLWPEGRAALALCNPPWLPARPHAPIEAALYDPDSRMLRAFLSGLAAHLLPGGEGWLILSDLAEHLGLRSREQLLAWIAEAGLVVAGRQDIRPRHAKAQDAGDALHAARAREVTSLWRLKSA